MAIKKSGEKTIRMFVFLFFFLHLFYLFSCDRDTGKNSPVQEGKIFTYDRIMFTTLFSVKILSPENQQSIDQDVEEIFEIIQRIGDDLDFHIKASYVNQLNHSNDIEISELYHGFFEENLDFYEKTDHYFSPFLGELNKAYNYFDPESTPPSKDEIEKNLEIINSSSLILKQNRIIKIGDAVIDFGGSLKGFLVDLFAVNLKSKGYNDFLINAGGDIKVSSSGDKIWSVGIQDPYDRSKVMAEYRLKNGSIVTSGDYERFFIYLGRKYFHILNPFTGEPDSNLSSVSVICDSCMEADIISTALFAMGLEKGRLFLKKFNYPVLFLWKDENKKRFYFNTSDIKIIDKGYDHE